MWSILVLVIAQPFARLAPGGTSSPCLWWPEGSAITYRVNGDGNPETPGDTEFEAVDRAFASWNSVLESCSGLRLLKGPTTTTRLAATRRFDPSPDENVVLFRQRR